MFHVMEFHINMFTMLIHMFMLPHYLMPLHINMIMKFVMELMRL